jgi:hypothetical protein
MGKSKTIEAADLIAGWTKEEIEQLELAFLYKMFHCDTVEAVDVTVAFARFMSRVKLDSDNYPIFLKLLQFENHWVVDALLAGSEPEKFFKAVQPNRFILESCFKMFKRWKPGGIYPKSLLVLFGMLKTAYEHPSEGYRTYPLTVPDVNNLGKHLDKSHDQSEPVNRTILRILDRIAALSDPGGLQLSDKKVLEVATQANSIRGKFLDTTKRLEEAIPAELLKRADYSKKEIKPSVVGKG